MVSSELFIGLPLIVASIILAEISILSSEKTEQTEQIKLFKSVFIILLTMPLLILFISSMLAFIDLFFSSYGIIDISIFFFGASYPLLIIGTIASMSYLSIEIYE